jgi:hypothetical protein
MTKSGVLELRSPIFWGKSDFCLQLLKFFHVFFWHLLLNFYIFGYLFENWIHLKLADFKLSKVFVALFGIWNFRIIDDIAYSFLLANLTHFIFFFIKQTKFILFSTRWCIDFILFYYFILVIVKLFLHGMNLLLKFTTLIDVY